MSILDHFKAVEEFTPETVEGYVALQLARQLRDLPNLNWYLRLLEKHSINEVVRAFQQSLSNTAETATTIERLRAYFHF
jgi:hypothetical protein